MNIGKRPTLPGKPKQLDIPDESALLVNITAEVPAVISRTYGNFSIPGCRKGRQTIRDRGEVIYDQACELGQEWAAEVVHAARGVMDFGKDYPKNEFIVHAAEVANDLALCCNSDLWGIGSTVTGEVSQGEAVRGFAGIFVADGELPSDEELSTARELLRGSDSALISQGHQTFAQFGPAGVKAISESFKTAAKRQGQDADWLYTVKDLPNCPHCGSQLKSANATVCATCNRDVAPKAETPKPSRTAARRRTAAA